MKMTKFFLVICVALGIAALLPLTSQAAPALYTCKVLEAGPVTMEGSTTVTKTIIKLQYVSGTPGFSPAIDFNVSNAARAKEFLAVALTALANGKQVAVYADAATKTLYNLKMKNI